MILMHAVYVEIEIYGSYVSTPPEIILNTATFIESISQIIVMI